ncbi:MAG: carnitine dehydratase [Cycloclasticus sp. symbiont of Bathymodiolus heckerae]|nr:MAG: carnitine dehydratase [Cycloclasticus sp. symbiont of Bathymodiolus heckerae]
MSDFKPLAGMRIVTLALNVPGPLAAKRWCDFGATVIKVEPPEGDPLEIYSAEWYHDVNIGQQKRRINLKTAEGKEALAQLLSTADLLLTAQRPAALERLGLGWDELQNSYPKINHIVIVGYPVPNENEAGHDLTYQASLGLLTPPTMPKTLVADMAGAERAALEGMALLMARKAGEKGQQVFIPLSEAADYMAQPLSYGLTSETGLLAGNVPEYALYETANGWLALAALEPHFSARLKQELGLSELSHQTVAEKLKQKTATEWAVWAKQRDIPLVSL